MEDDDFWIRCSLAGWRFKPLNSGKAIYRLHAGQMTSLLRVGDPMATIQASVNSLKHLIPLLDIVESEPVKTVLVRRLTEETARIAEMVSILDRK